jgi:hypothetical protein
VEGNDHGEAYTAILRGGLLSAKAVISQRPARLPLLKSRPRRGAGDAGFPAPVRAQPTREPDERADPKKEERRHLG